MRLLVLLLLCGCAAQMTEAQRELAEYEEQERAIAYYAWRNECLRQGGSVLIVNPLRHCKRSGGCVPDKSEWSQYRRINRVQCVMFR